MSNAKHLEILEKGKKEWNAWRATQKRRPNLSGAKLFEADLAGFDLRNTNLQGATLFGANQEGLVIREADKPGMMTTTIDDLDTAQYLFLLRENEKIVDKKVIEVGYLEAMRSRGVKNPKLPSRPKAIGPPKKKAARKKRAGKTAQKRVAKRKSAKRSSK